MENISRHGRRFKGNLGADPQKFEVGDQARSQDFASGGVTGQSIPPAGLYPGLKRPRLDFTRVHYGLGQFIPRVILSSRPIHTPQAKLYHYDINSVERYTQELFNLSTSYLGFGFVR